MDLGCDYPNESSVCTHDVTVRFGYVCTAYICMQVTLHSDTCVLYEFVITSKSTLSLVSPALAISSATVGGPGDVMFGVGRLPNSSVMDVWLKPELARRLRRALRGALSEMILNINHMQTIV